MGLAGNPHADRSRYLRLHSKQPKSAGLLQLRTVRIPLAHLRARAKERPAGYLEDVLARGQVIDSDLHLSSSAYAGLVAKYRAPPTLCEMLAGALRELRKWRAGGYPVVSWKVFLARRAECRLCLHRQISWPSVRTWPFVRHLLLWLLPRCALCGCTDLKLWLATAECPLPPPSRRWHPMPPTPPPY